MLGTRNDILNSSVQPLDQGTYSQSEPPLSAYRARWANLVPWDRLSTYVTVYMQSLGVGELAAVVDPGGFMAIQGDVLAVYPQPTSEAALHPPLNLLFWIPHNFAAKPLGTTHLHAQIVMHSGRYPFFGEPDFMFDVNGEPVGIIELKTFWKVTTESIDDVFYGSFSPSP